MKVFYCSFTVLKIANIIKKEKNTSKGIGIGKYQKQKYQYSRAFRVPPLTATQPSIKVQQVIEVIPCDFFTFCAQTNKNNCRVPVHVHESSTVRQTNDNRSSANQHSLTSQIVPVLVCPVLVPASEKKLKCSSKKVLRKLNSICFLRCEHNKMQVIRANHTRTIKSFLPLVMP